MKSSIVGLKELRENMDSYIDAVNKGKSFVIVRKSRPVFRMTPLDAWGDEGHWSPVIDLTKVKRGGVPIDEVIASLKRLNA
jgi:prevent-host-death family protein